MLLHHSNKTSQPTTSNHNNHNNQHAREESEFPFMRDVAEYDKIIKIGHGTFGEVIKAKCRRTGNFVALKKILMENEKEGFPITALREIRILQKIKHNNITELLEVCASKATSFNRNRSTFYMVFTFCEHDLAGLFSNPQVHFSVPEIKFMMRQLFMALDYLQQNQLLHRDLKSANILVNRKGVLKLADFGLARILIKANVQAYTNGTDPRSQKLPQYTNRVVTMWYRPPELLLGARSYTQAIDIWGAGCIMTEFWMKTPLLQGDSEIQQLKLIVNMCGEITPEVWPGVETLELYTKMKETVAPQFLAQKGHNRNLMSSAGLHRPKHNARLRERMRNIIKDPNAMDLLEELLTLDPSRRLWAFEALSHPFFQRDPQPASVEPMLKRFTSSMFEYLAHHHRRPAHHHQHQAPTNLGAPAAPPISGGPPSHKILPPPPAPPAIFGEVPSTSADTKKAPVSRQDAAAVFGRF